MDEEQPFSLSLRTYGGEQAAHSHAHHQIILALNGTLELETDRGSGLVDACSAAFVCEGSRHAYRGVGDNSFLILDTHFDEECFLQENPPTPFVALDEGVAGLCSFAKLNSELLAQDAAARHRLGALLLQGLETSLTGAPATEPAGLVRARAFMREHLADPITLDDIAHASGMSVASLHRHCHTWHGQSPARLLQSMRLSEARQRLMRSADSIAEIALACGYSEQSALSRAFKRTFGVSPQHFRSRSTGRH